MATITSPIILDSTGQDIKTSIDLLTANINRTASNIPYDNNLTIKGKIDAIDLSKGGTIKADSGNTVVTIEGASSSNYGQLCLGRSGSLIKLVANSNITADRNVVFPNIAGGVAIESNYFGETITGGTNDTLGTLIETLRTNYFDNALIRKNLLRFSSLDNQANMIFHCDRFQNQNTSVWTSLRGGSGGFVAISLTFGSGSTAVRKYEWTTSGMTITALTGNSASGITITII